MAVTCDCEDFANTGFCGHFNTASVDELLQAPLNVKLDEDILQTYELPTELGATTNMILPAASNAVKLLNRDPRRRQVTISAIGEDICIAGTQGEAQTFAGYMLSAIQQVPQHFSFRDELWVRPVLITSATATFAATTEPAIVSILTERWSR